MKKRKRSNPVIYDNDPLWLELENELRKAPEASNLNLEDNYFETMRDLEKMARSKTSMPKWQFILTKRIWELMKSQKITKTALAQYKSKNSPSLDDGMSIGKSNLTGYIGTSVNGERRDSLINMPIKALLLCSECFDVSTDYLLGKTDSQKQRSVRARTTLEKQRKFWKKTNLQKQQQSWVKRGINISEEALATLRESDWMPEFVNFLLCQPEINKIVNELQNNAKISAEYRYIFSFYSDEVQDLLLKAFDKYWESHIKPNDIRSYMLTIEETLQGNRAYDLSWILDNGISDATLNRMADNALLLKEQLQGDDLLYRSLSLALAEETFAILEHKAVQHEGLNLWNHDLSKVLGRYIEEQAESELETLKELVEQEEAQAREQAEALARMNLE